MESHSSHYMESRRSLCMESQGSRYMEINRSHYMKWYSSHYVESFKQVSPLYGITQVSLCGIIHVLLYGITQVSFYVITHLNKWHHTDSIMGHHTGLMWKHTGLVMWNHTGLIIWNNTGLIICNNSNLVFFVFLHTNKLDHPREASNKEVSTWTQLSKSGKMGTRNWHYEKVRSPKCCQRTGCTETAGRDRRSWAATVGHGVLRWWKFTTGMVKNIFVSSGNRSKTIKFKMITKIYKSFFSLSVIYNTKLHYIIQ